MASKFIVPVRDQAFMEFVSYREQLGDDHLVWTLIDVVEGLDLSELYDSYAPDVGQGERPALDPVMMATLLLFGYCEGKRSSRQLEDACRSYCVASDLARQDRVCFRPHWVGLLDHFEEAQ